MAPLNNNKYKLTVNTNKYSTFRNAFWNVILKLRQNCI